MLKRTILSGRALPVVEPTRYLAYSPNGRTVATVSRSGTVETWDAATAQRTSPPARLGPSVFYVLLAPNGESVVARGDGTAQLVHTATGKLIGERFGSSRARVEIKYSRDSRFVAITVGLTTTVLDTETARPVGPPMLLGPYVTTFLDDGRSLAASDGSLWNFADGTRRSAGAYANTRISLDGKTCVTTNVKTTVQFWDTTTGEPQGEALEHIEEVKSMFLGPGGSRAVSVTATRYRLWDVRSGRQVGESILNQHPRGEPDVVAFSPDGALVAIAVGDRHAQVRDAFTGQTVGLPLEHGGVVRNLAFSPAGTTLAAISGPNTFRLWDVPTFRPVGVGLTDFNVDWIKFDLTRNFVAAWRYNSPNVALLSINYGTPPPGPIGVNGRLVSVGFGPVLRQLLTVTDQDIQGWDWQTTDRFAATRKFPAPASSADFVASGRRIVITSAGNTGDRTIRILDSRTLAQIGGPLDHSGNPSAGASSPSGDLLWTRDGGTSRLWRMQPTPREGILVGPGGRTVATELNSKIQLWDGPLVHPIGKEVAANLGQARFSPDGAWFASPSYSKPWLSVWNARSGELAAGPNAIDGSVVRWAFSPDSRCVAAGTAQSRLCLGHLQRPAQMSATETKSTRGDRICRVQGGRNDVVGGARRHRESYIHNVRCGEGGRVEDREPVKTGHSDLPRHPRDGRSHSVISAGFVPALGCRYGGRRDGSDLGPEPPFGRGGGQAPDNVDPASHGDGTRRGRPGPVPEPRRMGDSSR